MPPHSKCEREVLNYKIYVLVYLNVDMTWTRQVTRKWVPDTVRDDLKNLSKSNSDSVGVAECFAVPEISHLFANYCHFTGRGVSK